jgi:glycosyltransferase involved in cell wall biosynthesis
MSLVSIIIPVYNAEKVLEETIVNALAQTYRHREIIVVDDGSSDNSVQIAKKFEGTGVKVIEQINAGAAIARNTGLAYASGKYIQFLDAGDLLSNDKIEKQVNALHGSDTKLAVCNYVFFHSTNDLGKLSAADQSRFIYSTTDTISFLLNLWGGNGESNFIQTNSWLTPVHLIRKAGGWRNYRCPDDDGEFFARMALAADEIIYVSDTLNYYRVDDDSNQLSRNTNRKYLQNTLLTIDLKRKYIEERGGHPLSVKAFARQYLDFAVYQYPQQKILSRIAWQRYKSCHQALAAPLLGSKVIELVKLFFGWKAARIIRFYLRGI